MRRSPLSAVAALAPAALLASGAGGQPPGDESVKVVKAAVSVSTRRFVRFTQPRETGGHDLASLHISGEAGGGYAGRVASVRNIVAKDDRGNLSVSAGGQAHASGRLWSVRVPLSALSPEARALEWVEGDVFLYRRAASLKAEFPLPLPDDGARQEREGVVFEITALTPGEGVSGPRLEGRVTAPQLSRLQGSDGRGVHPVLVGASGKEYRATSGGGSHESGGHGVIAHIDCGYAPAPEPIVLIRVEAVYHGEPERLTSFRLKDIPVPQDRWLPAAAGAPPHSVPAPSALLDDAGGTLASEVLIGDRAAPPGVLSIGLTRMDAGPAPIRWAAVGVTEGGQARLERLKPGGYRVLRVYRPAEQRVLPGRGRWLNGELRVKVTPGKDTRLPPLRWVAEP